MNETEHDDSRRDEIEFNGRCEKIIYHWIGSGDMHCEERKKDNAWWCGGLLQANV